MIWSFLLGGGKCTSGHSTKGVREVFEKAILCCWQETIVVTGSPLWSLLKIISSSSTTFKANKEFQKHEEHGKIIFHRSRFMIFKSFKSMSYFSDLSYGVKKTKGGIVTYPCP